MRHLPINLLIENQPCLVVGGGEVAARKALWLRRAGARVTVIAPVLCATLEPLVTTREVCWIADHYQSTQLTHAVLVIAATDDASLNARVAAEARAAAVWVNVVDAPALCSFIVPAVIDRSPLLISISSGGTAPVLATRLRERLEAQLPAHYGRLASLLGDWRERVQARFDNPRARRAFWRQVLDSEIPTLIATDAAAAETRLAALLQATPSQEAPPRCSVLRLTSSDPADLTLRALALLGDADHLLHDPDVPAEVLDYARRDALRLRLPAPVEDPAQLPASPGHTVYVTLRAG